jgi:hypothetical protein
MRFVLVALLLILLIPIAAAVAQARFRHATDSAALRMMSAAPTTVGPVVTEADLAPLRLGDPSAAASAFAWTAPTTTPPCRRWSTSEAQPA